MAEPFYCWNCNEEAELLYAKIGREDSCEDCGRDLRCCKSCRFWDPGYRNECTEPMSERILDREKGNFCNFFEPAFGKRPGPAGDKADAKAKLDALFKNLK